MAFAPGRAKRLIAVRHRKAFEHVGQVLLERGAVLVWQPNLEDERIAYKALAQPYLFAHRSVRQALKTLWEGAWLAVGRAKPVHPGWDIDHVFPVCWAEIKGLEYVLLNPVESPANRSAGAGVEKAAARKEREELLARYVAVDVSGDYAYLTAPAIAKLLSVAPGPGAKQYPGLEKIKPDLEALQALLAY